MAEENTELKTCPCCGKLTLEKPVKIKEEQLDRFTACMLSGEEYSKTYYLFNGKLAITVTELSDQIKDKMNLLMSKFTLIEDEDTRDVANMFIVRLFTLLPIISINKQKQDISIQAVLLPVLEEAIHNTGNKEWLEKHYKMLFDAKVSGGIGKDILDKVCAKHLQNTILLKKSGFDTDFFIGIVQG